jgi:hypothetical protein
VKRLEDRLLAIGGEGVVAQHDAFLAPLLERGRLFHAEGSKAVRGVRCHCHQAVALHYLEHRLFGGAGHLALVTGYSLARGRWWRHSWLWDGARVLETDPNGQEVYYGVVLTDAEAAEFVLWAVGALLPTPPSSRRGVVPPPCGK